MTHHNRLVASFLPSSSCPCSVHITMIFQSRRIQESPGSPLSPPTDPLTAVTPIDLDFCTSACCRDMAHHFMWMGGLQTFGHGASTTKSRHLLSSLPRSTWLLLVISAKTTHSHSIRNTRRQSCASRVVLDQFMSPSSNFHGDYSEPTIPCIRELSSTDTPLTAQIHYCQAYSSATGA